MTSLRLTSSEYQAIVDGTDPVSARHRFRPVLGPDEPVADLPPERDYSLDDWQDRRVDEDDEDRTLTDEMPPGYDRLWESF